MRIAVFSDMHGNDVAFEAALEDMRRSGADQLVCLGDAVQGGPQPAEVVARLRELACPVVMGNADDWLLTGEDAEGEPDPERRRELDAVRVWSLAQLSEADRAFIAGFQPTVTVDLGDGRGLLGFHGSPRSFVDIIVPETPADEVWALLSPHLPQIMAGGHTHIQQLRQLGDSFYFGCGSVGLAFRHGQPEGPLRYDPWAEYALLTVEGGRVGLEFRRVPFDAGRVREIFRTSGRPYGEKAATQLRDV
jgi:predicted phosphodiesterase